MHVSVNGVRLFFDVEGTKFVPDGPMMREKPALLMLHGGPRFDHSGYRPAYSAFAAIAPIVYFDHRGDGRLVGDVGGDGDDAHGLPGVVAEHLPAGREPPRPPVGAGGAAAELVAHRPARLDRQPAPGQHRRDGVGVDGV